MPLKYSLSWFSFLNNFSITKQWYFNKALEGTYFKEIMGQYMPLKYSPSWFSFLNNFSITKQWYSDLGPKGAKKEPKNAKRVPKDTKKASKGSQNDTKNIYIYIPVNELEANPDLFWSIICMGLAPGLYSRWCVLLRESALWAQILLGAISISTYKYIYIYIY